MDGYFRRLKDKIDYILFAIFFMLPLIHIKGIPLVYLNIPDRKFHIFGLTIWPQELYFLHLFMLFLGLLLFFVTAVWGRIWCGFVCPQTTFTDVYDWVGRLVGGKSYGKRSASTALYIRVYAAWLIISLVFSFFFVAYFSGFYNMVDQLARGDIFAHLNSIVPRTWILFWLGSTVIAMGNMVYFREEMCKVVCPYGRFQTALLDSHSTIVSYSKLRGEPRRKPRQKDHAGDCISCNMCLVVCPTGIDIREGLQIGCLSCGLCVDACTSIMAKEGKETLIDYYTVEQAENPGAPVHYVRARSVIYATLLTVIVSGFVYLLSVRVPFNAEVSRDRQLQNAQFDKKTFANGYILQLGNMSLDPLRVKVALETDDNASFKGKFTFTGSEEIYSIEPGGRDIVPIRMVLTYVLAEGEAKPRVPIKIAFRVNDLNNPDRFKITESVFSFPQN